MTNEEIIQGNKLIIDLSIFDGEEKALAKITEAVAKVYFDGVLDRKKDVSKVSALYRILFNLNPNYRLVLQSVSGFEKYQHLNPEMALITSLPIYKS